MRIARAGTIEALDADYTRTAYLKGLTRDVVLRRHVLRNSLLPTITVVATQVGYLIGGLVVVETRVQLPGDRVPDLQRGQGQGLPDARVGRAHDRHRVPRRDDHRRPDVRAPEPANPVLDAIELHGDLPVDVHGPIPAGRPLPRSCRSRPNGATPLRRLLASKTFVAGALILLFWIVRRDLRNAFHARARTPPVRTRSRASRARTGSARTRSGATSSRGSSPARARSSIDRDARDPPRRRGRDDPRARHRVLPRRRRQHPEPDHRRGPRAAAVIIAIVAVTVARASRT